MSCCNANSRPAAHETAEVSDQTQPTFRPNVDVIETPEAFTILADVPGATSDSIDVRVEGRTLTLRAGVSARTRTGARQVIREYGVGDFERTFRLGDGVDTNSIAAELKDGVLSLRLSKAAATQARRIAVQSN